MSCSLKSPLLPLLVALTVTPLFADTWAPPRPRVFASEGGTFGFKVLEPKFLGTATGLLFDLDPDGEERTVWNGKLVNVPSRVRVSEDGKRVLTIDTYGKLGHEHALVVYDNQSKVLADYKLEDLLTPLEIKFLPTTVSSRAWTAYARFTFSPDRRHFVITLNCSKLFREQLQTAKEFLSMTSDPESQKHWRNRIEEAQSGLKEPGERVLKIELGSGKLEGEIENR
ncbi:MAG: hypothetical protein ACREA0_06360, partial [bacterium]